MFMILFKYMNFMVMIFLFLVMWMGLFFLCFFWMILDLISMNFILISYFSFYYKNFKFFFYYYYSYVINFIFSYKSFFMSVFGVFFLPIWFFLKYKLSELFISMFNELKNMFMMDSTSAFLSLLFLSFLLYLWMDIYMADYKYFYKEMCNCSLQSTINIFLLNMEYEDKFNLSLFLLFKMMFMFFIENLMFSVLILSLKFSNMVKNFSYMLLWYFLFILIYLMIFFMKFCMINYFMYFVYMFSLISLIFLIFKDLFYIFLFLTIYWLSDSMYKKKDMFFALSGSPFLKEELKLKSNFKV